MKPVIGLTPSHELDTNHLYMYQTYTKAVMAAGGIPVILPLNLEKAALKQLVDSLDGFLFTGGPDIHPFFFGEETLRGCGSSSPQRDSQELTMLPMAMDSRKPILGICRGIQLINTALGGTLYQDIPTQLHQDFPVAHTQPFPSASPSHYVTISRDSRLFQITGKEKIPVNSMHHQACKRLGSGLIPAAWSSDELIEAVEMPDYPYLLGVQWHPEHLWETDDAAKSLFSSFINACR